MPDEVVQHPTVPGKVDGIIALDPMQIQCRGCGHVETQPEGRGVAVFILTVGMLFCAVDKVRRCRGCRVEHNESCQRCRKSQRLEG